MGDDENAMVRAARRALSWLEDTEKKEGRRRAKRVKMIVESCPPTQIACDPKQTINIDRHRMTDKDGNVCVPKGFCDPRDKKRSEDVVARELRKMSERFAKVEPAIRRQLERTPCNVWSDLETDPAHIPKTMCGRMIDRDGRSRCRFDIENETTGVGTCIERDALREPMREHADLERKVQSALATIRRVDEAYAPRRVGNRWMLTKGESKAEDLAAFKTALREYVSARRDSERWMQTIIFPILEHLAKEQRTRRMRAVVENVKLNEILERNEEPTIETESLQSEVDDLKRRVEIEDAKWAAYVKYLEGAAESMGYDLTVKTDDESDSESDNVLRAGGNTTKDDDDTKTRALRTAIRRFRKYLNPEEKGELLKTSDETTREIVRGHYDRMFELETLTRLNETQARYADAYYYRRPILQGTEIYRLSHTNEEGVNRFREVYDLERRLLQTQDKNEQEQIEKRFATLRALESPEIASVNEKFRNFIVRWIQAYGLPKRPCTRRKFELYKPRNRERDLSSRLERYEISNSKAIVPPEEKATFETLMRTEKSKRVDLMKGDSEISRIARMYRSDKIIVREEDGKTVEEHPLHHLYVNVDADTKDNDDVRRRNYTVKAYDKPVFASYLNYTMNGWFEKTPHVFPCMTQRLHSLKEKGLSFVREFVNYMDAFSPSSATEEFAPSWESSRCEKGFDKGTEVCLRFCYRMEDYEKLEADDEKKYRILMPVMERLDEGMIPGQIVKVGVYKEKAWSSNQLQLNIVELEDDEYKLKALVEASRCKAIKEPKTFALVLGKSDEEKTPFQKYCSVRQEESKGVLLPAASPILIRFVDEDSHDALGILYKLNDGNTYHVARINPLGEAGGELVPQDGLQRKKSNNVVRRLKNIVFGSTEYDNWLKEYNEMQSVKDFFRDDDTDDGDLSITEQMNAWTFAKKPLTFSRERIDPIDTTGWFTYTLQDKREVGAEQIEGIVVEGEIYKAFGIFHGDTIRLKNTHENILVDTRTFIGRTSSKQQDDTSFYYPIPVSQDAQGHKYYAYVESKEGTKEGTVHYCANLTTYPLSKLKKRFPTLVDIPMTPPNDMMKDRINGIRPLGNYTYEFNISKGKRRFEIVGDKWVEVDPTLSGGGDLSGIYEMWKNRAIEVYNAWLDRRSGLLRLDEDCTEKIEYVDEWYDNGIAREFRRKLYDPKENVTVNDMIAYRVVLYKWGIVSLDRSEKATLLLNERFKWKGEEYRLRGIDSDKIRVLKIPIKGGVKNRPKKKKKKKKKKKRKEATAEETSEEVDNAESGDEDDADTEHTIRYEKLMKDRHEKILDVERLANFETETMKTFKEVWSKEKDKDTLWRDLNDDTKGEAVLERYFSSMFESEEGKMNPAVSQRIECELKRRLVLESVFAPAAESETEKITKWSELKDRVKGMTGRDGKSIVYFDVEKSHPLYDVAWKRKSSCDTEIRCLPTIFLDMETPEAFRDLLIEEG